MSITQKPAVFFDSPLPDKLGDLLVDKGWNGVTLPPVGIFFKHKKEDVPEWLFKHELKHWYQAQLLGIAFYPILLLDYKINGYDKSLLEKQAKEYQKKPLTVTEKMWWNSYKG